MISLYTTGHLKEVLKNVDIVSTLLDPSLIVGTEKQNWIKLFYFQ